MIGVDEVGRGAWAGPLVVVAARDKGIISDEIKDSKLMSRGQREAMMDVIVDSCDIGVGWVDAKEIDVNGLSISMRLAVKRALNDIVAIVDEEIIMDGNINYCPDYFNNVKTIIRADRDFGIVGAASIYAKVIRDKYMVNLSNQYPLYGFDRHVGYGTNYHKEALVSFGLTEFHRRSFKPVSRILNNES